MSDNFLLTAEIAGFSSNMLLNAHLSVISISSDMENGFLHAKCMMTDSRVSCCGTANMDIRSFELNFEVNATIYDEESTERLEETFLEDLTRCREVTKEVYEARDLWVRIRGILQGVALPYTIISSLLYSCAGIWFHESSVSWALLL